MTTLTDAASHTPLKGCEDLCGRHTNQGQLFKDAAVKCRRPTNRSNRSTRGKIQICQKFADKANLADNPFISVGQRFSKIDRQADLYSLLISQFNQFIVEKKSFRLA
jgi:hypothetical protein